MQLHTLRPKRGADLEHLRTLLDGRGWRASLPAAFPDAVLLRLAHDFRNVEGSICDERPLDEEVPSMASAMFVVMNLLLQHPAREGNNGSLEISERGVMHALQLYQWALEREIVMRIVGLKTSKHTDDLIDGMRRCLNE